MCSLTTMESTGNQQQKDNRKISKHRATKRTLLNNPRVKEEMSIVTKTYNEWVKAKIQLTWCFSGTLWHQVFVLEKRESQINNRSSNLNNLVKKA